MTWQTKISSLRNDSRVVASAASALSFAAGGTLAYFVTKKIVETKYTRIAEEEIQEAKKYYGDIHEKQREYNPEELIEELKKQDGESDLERQLEAKYAVGDDQRIAYEKIAKDYQPEVVPDYDKLEEETEVVEEEVRDESGRVVSRNIFVTDKSTWGEGDEWDQELEDSKRLRGQPYMITQEQFLTNNLEHDQTTVTYYEEDEVLADERDSPINDKERTVGVEHLEKFGYGSGDNHIAYVRNESMEMDFEITHSEGSYTQEVLGFKHSDDGRPRIRKFRGDDE